MRLKFIFVNACMLFCVIFAKAQLVVTPSDSIGTTETVTILDQPELLIFIKNTSGSAETFGWVPTDLQAPHAWDVNVCDVVNCYTFGYTIRTFTLAAGDSGFMKPQITHNCTSGTAKLKVNVWNVADSVGTAQTLTYTFNLTAASNCLSTGISNVEANSNLHVYPNPATSTLSFDLTGYNTAVTAELYDLTGRNVKTISKTAGNAIIEMPLAGISSGMYIARISDVNGNLIAAKRITKLD